MGFIKFALSILLRVLWFCVIGWWLALIWLVLCIILIITVIFSPIGVFALFKTWKIATLGESPKKILGAVGAMFSSRKSKS